MFQFPASREMFQLHGQKQMFIPSYKPQSLSKGNFLLPFSFIFLYQSWEFEREGKTISLNWYWVDPKPSVLQA